MNQKEKQKYKKEFEHIVKSCESKVEKTMHLSKAASVFQVFIQYLNKHIKNEVKSKPVYIQQYTREFLEKTSYSIVGLFMVEYRLSNLLNSHWYGLDHAYNDVVKMIATRKIDLNEIDEKSIDYNFNTEKDLQTLVMIHLKTLRKQQHAIRDALTPEIKLIFDTLKTASKNQRKQVFKKLVDKYSKRLMEKCSEEIDGSSNESFEEINEDDLMKNMESMYKIYVTSTNSEKEKELIKEKIEIMISDSSKNLKDACIDDILLCIEYLDEFGFLKYYTQSNNSKFEKILGKSVKLDFNYDDVKSRFTKEELSKLNIEQLIVLGAFWINRVNKIIKELNASIYMLSNDKLYNIDLDKNGDIVVNVDEKIHKNILLKISVIHRMFEKVLMEVDEENTDGPIFARKQIELICERYGEYYEKYFNELLGKTTDSYGESRNSLRRDLSLSFVSENAIRNSYVLKNLYVKSLLFSLLNNRSKLVENFGYIPETYNEDISKKKVVLIGVDLKGFNMPFRLHVDKEMLLEVLKQSRDGDTNFPIYEGANDFHLPDLKNISAQILIPLSQEEEKRVNTIYESYISRYNYDVNEPKKFGNIYLPLIMHLNYLTSSGKFPEHLLSQGNNGGKKKNKKKKFKQRFINLDPDNVEKVR